MTESQRKHWEPQYRVIEAEYLSSEVSYQALSKYSLPEIAFVGRSNAGKSSLLNALCGRSNLARVSKTPGRTQALNYFAVRLRQTKAENCAELRAHFVDLPGFGYAAVSAKTKGLWGELLHQYITKRRELSQIVLLLDVRRDLESEERWFLEQSLQAQIVLALTKIDKVSKNELQRKLSQLTSELTKVSAIVPTAANAAKKQGISELCDEIGGRLFEAR